MRKVLVIEITTFYKYGQFHHYLVQRYRKAPGGKSLPGAFLADPRWSHLPL
jgi:hypothetical protein